MIRSVVYVLFSFSSCIFLFSTVMHFISFLSSQSVQGIAQDEQIFPKFTLDVCLVVLFMAQHSLMATKFFQSKMTGLGLQAIIRSVYIFATATVLHLLMYHWQPIPEISFWLIDTNETPLLSLFFHILHWVLWIVLLLEVLMMEPLELIGVRQVYNFIKGLYPSTLLLPPRLQKLLKSMPHPGGGCFIAILWLHPCMTFDRMILATVLTAYLCCGYGVTEGDYIYMKHYSSTAYTRTETDSVQESRLYYER